MASRKQLLLSFNYPPLSPAYPPSISNHSFTHFFLESKSCLLNSQEIKHCCLSITSSVDISPHLDASISAQKYPIPGIRRTNLAYSLFN
ncbi:hypothetical protein AMECASPLE_035373 [Ameca splendens]|uniref:Uncharacterized protein n=1 Tax=Ameca splendens TaxID=208324 RepID=A0ABV1AEU7_9TELE